MNKSFSIYEIADLNRSSLTSRDNYEYVNYLDTSNLTRNQIENIQYLDTNFPSRAKRKVKADTILYSTVRPNQEHFGIVENTNINNLIVSTGFTTIDVKSNEINPKYLYYKLSNPVVTSYLQTIAENSVSAYPSIKPEEIGNLRFKFPTLKVQQKIAKVLSALDNKIELNNLINAELEAMAKTLYDYWFVQFDFPFDSAQGPASQNAPEVDERTPVAERSRGYKSSGGKMVYDEVLKREIPEGWEVTVFNDWINKTKTGDWGKEEVEGNYTERVHCVRGADINGLNGKGDVKAPVRYILKNNLSKALQPNDFIVEISGGSPVQSTGRIALLTEESFERFDGNVICSNFCKAISLKDKKYVFNFKQEWQRLYDAGVFFGYEGKTSGIKNFLFDSFMDSYHIVKPSKEIAKKYHQFVSSLEKKKQLNLLQNQQLAQLRDWLLPMLMNGQVRVGSGEYESEEGSLGMVAEEPLHYHNLEEKTSDWYDQRFELWVSQQGLAARGNIDKATLRELFDAMNDEDK